MTRKKPQAKLKAVELRLPWMNLAWESDESEVRALRDLVDQLRSRRAFAINRGMLMEQPVYFIRSVTEMRQEIRRLLSQLPLEARESRILMLTVMDWLAEILDTWQVQMANTDPRVWDFEKLKPRQMRVVMQQSWTTVEDVRRRLDKLLGDLEIQLDIKKKEAIG